MVAEKNKQIAGQFLRSTALITFGAIASMLSAFDIGIAAPAEQAAVIHAGDGQGSAAVLMRRASLGHAAAQTRLGFMYATGRGMPQHLGEAAYWYRRAAEQGDGRAQYFLGLSYDKGRGVLQDLVLAHKWLNLSAAIARGEDREHIVRLRDAVASKMTFQQLMMAEQLALQWRPVREW